MREQLKSYIERIVERTDQKIIGIEVKLNRSADNSDVKNLLWLKEKMKSDMLDMILINTGSEAYRRKDGVAVIPAALLGA